ncbi:MAG: phospho-N-acetylmuramoyl-pentapeptide-transferase [Candidatus Buchananbacteria bacterium RBG_13_36_9]|uniref:Phospho-N-acetylmuramoyl-pentapeptide-transferase n=1 Tax=Candidatus Buchananbacteria bacterium RBG_13_36_9 TaxID=1797530 RepID=A0A1G1XPD8_9BACT|nr:MAG: phospho-N-acetylmuramoyl-pentapeptide-transferase [Candidatus Buchananbacteria bacterium RBG_13_36_9]
MDTFVIIKIFFFTILAFIIAVSWTPILTFFMYKYKLGKRIRDNESAPVMASFHEHKAGTPTMGGLLIWVTALIIAVVFYYLARFTDWEIFDKLNFLTRSQTLLPLGALVAAALVGLIDDIFNIKGIGPNGGGLQMRYKLMIYTAIALVGAFWFYFKLDWDLIRLPFIGDFQIGWWYIPIFVFIIVGASNAVNITDGLDGLAGGLLASSFAAYGVIAFTQGRYDLATFCGVIVGGLLAFLWFNINPARFFMGDTGSMSLGVTLGIVAMLTNSVLILPIIGFLFVLETLSVIIQMCSKKFLGRKVFISAPLHHHLQAMGWPETKIVMRFWLIATVMAFIGVIISLIDKLY